jgi:hypothetical protein
LTPLPRRLSDWGLSVSCRKRVFQFKDPRYRSVLAFAALQHGRSRRSQVANFLQARNALRTFVCIGVQHLAVPNDCREFIHYVVRQKAEVVSTKFVHIDLTFLALDRTSMNDRANLLM